MDQINRSTAQEFVNKVWQLCERFRNLLKSDDRFSNVKSVEHDLFISYDLYNFNKTKLPCRVIRFEKDDLVCIDFRISSLDFHSGIKKIELCTNRGILIEITPDSYIYLRGEQWTYMAYDGDYTINDVGYVENITASERILDDKTIKKIF